jgi:hypothetical protein
MLAATAWGTVLQRYGAHYRLLKQAVERAWRPTQRQQAGSEYFYWYFNKNNNKQISVTADLQ